MRAHSSSFPRRRVSIICNERVDYRFRRNDEIKKPEFDDDAHLFIGMELEVLA